MRPSSHYVLRVTAPSMILIEANIDIIISQSLNQGREAGITSALKEYSYVAQSLEDVALILTLSAR